MSELLPSAKISWVRVLTFGRRPTARLRLAMGRAPDPGSPAVLHLAGLPRPLKPSGAHPRSGQAEQRRYVLRTVIELSKSPLYKESRCSPVSYFRPKWHAEYCREPPRKVCTAARSAFASSIFANFTSPLSMGQRRPSCSTNDTDNGWCKRRQFGLQHGSRLGAACLVFILSLNRNAHMYRRATPG